MQGTLLTIRPQYPASCNFRLIVETYVQSEFLFHYFERGSLGTANISYYYAICLHIDYALTPTSWQILYDFKFILLS